MDSEKSRVDFDKLNELVMPLYEWLQDNYDPHTSIIIDSGSVRIVRDDCGMPLPIIVTYGY